MSGLTRAQLRPDDPMQADVQEIHRAGPRSRTQTDRTRGDTSADTTRSVSCWGSPPVGGFSDFGLLPQVDVSGGARAAPEARVCARADGDW